jgi:hypothetical protein
MKVIETNKFSALFWIKEWWQIFRANLSGFLVAFGIYYLASIILIFATIILSCLIIILFPAITFYRMLIMYTTGAIAYKDGKIKLANQQVNDNAST